MNEGAGMNEMIERLARTICDAIGPNPDGRKPTLYPPYEKLPPNWTFYVPAARAAVEAMREPTEAMILAIEQAMMETTSMTREAVIKVWMAGIDEARR